MRRRTLLRGGFAGLGVALAGCSKTATTGVDTNVLVLKNTLDTPVDVRVEATGEVDLSLVYPLGATETERIEDYVTEGSYTLTVTATIHADGEAIDIDDTATTKWDPDRCHDKRIVVRKNEIGIRSADC